MSDVTQLERQELRRAVLALPEPLLSFARLLELLEYADAFGERNAVGRLRDGELIGLLVLASYGRAVQ